MIGVPNPQATDWKQYAESLKRYLEKAKKYIATSLLFDKNNSANAEHGALTWNQTDDTLDLGHKNGVVQQIGLEQYMRGENLTGATIPNGSIVGFAGVNGEIKISKYIADGSIDNLYFIGVLTQDLANGEVGMVTTYGKVRGLDTSSWTKGTILYASPTTAGLLTSTKPTAPNEVVVVAAVLVSDAVNGEILVRPTIPFGLDYGDFHDTTDQTLAAANTAYPITLNSVDVAHGISIVSSSRITFVKSGQYQINVSLQVTSSNSASSTVYYWLRQNGTDSANTRRDFTIKSNGDTKVISTSYMITAQASDYAEVMWAGDTTNLILDSIASTAFAPAAPSAIVTVSQIQL